MARFIQLLNDWAVDRQRRIQTPAIYHANPQLPVLINQVKAGDVTLPFFADRVPGSAWLTLWAETYPGMTQHDVLADLQHFYPQAQATDSVLAAFEPQWQPIRWLDGSAVATDHPGVQLLAQVTSAVRRQEAAVQGALFACDGPMFNLYSSTPMVLLGPSGVAQIDQRG
jgi:acetylornithine deacetylase